jgi:hypothetical protein
MGIFTAYATSTLKLFNRAGKKGKKTAAFVTLAPPEATPWRETSAGHPSTPTAVAGAMAGQEASPRQESARQGRKE